MLVQVETRVEGVAVHVEVDAGPGSPRTVIIGVPAEQASELMLRVQRIMTGRGYQLPAGRTVVTVNPGVERESQTLDLAIADGLLMATGQMPRAVG
jgi:predicted ATPase with chaperone activity